MADAAGNHYGPFDNSVNPDAEDYTEDNYYRVHRESGVVSGGGLTFSGLTASLAPIEARVLGSFFWRDTPWNGSSPATAAGSNPRRDMLVLRQTKTNGSTPGTVLPVILQGTPAGSPADPAYDQDTDEPLWSWQVPGNGGTAVTGQKDLRRQVGSESAGPHLLTMNQTSSASATGTTRVQLPGTSGTVTVTGNRWVKFTVHAQSAEGASGGEQGRLILRIDGIEVRRAQWRNSAAGSAGEVSAQVTYSAVLTDGSHSVNAAIIRIIGGSKVTVDNTQLDVMDGGPA